LMTAIVTMRKAVRAIGAYCVVLVCAALFSASAWAQAGYVHEVSGMVSLQRISAKAVPARIGDTFEGDTVFRTGSDGKAVLKFADGQIVALGVDSALRVVRYRYVPNNLMLSTSTIELMRGEMRFVSGIIGAAYREGIHISAGNSQAAIQNQGGADFTVLFKPDAQEAGAVAVARGEVSVRTAHGPIYKVEAGQYVRWQTGRTPAGPIPIAAAPAVTQAAVAGLWGIVVPASNPVAVAPAARTAVLVAAAAVAPGGAARGGAASGGVAPSGVAPGPVNLDAKEAGYVASVANTATMQAASGKATAATVGTTFEPGTTFNTGNDARMVLKFADGQLVVLGPRSALNISQYQFDPCNIKTSQSILELIDGAIRYVSGTIHAENREGVSITAGASIIDMLNADPADFTVAVNTRGQEVGVARVAQGDISVHTPYGAIDRIAADQSNIWGPRKTPGAPIPVETALGVVQAAVTLQASELPDNTLVAVLTAARAAAANAAASRAQAAANADPANARLQAAAQDAAEQASIATQAANSASRAVAVTARACTLEELPATAAGPALAEVAAAPQLPPLAVPVLPPVTPGAGGGCTGSKC
jgi:hypothetical protein